MTRVVEVPGHFDHQAFDQFAQAFGAPEDERLLFDAHATKWGSPYGLVGLLAAGQWLMERERPKPLLTIPNDRDVAHYWARTDVHSVVDRIQDRAAAILHELGLEAQATMGFAMALSEACQNIVEHAGTGGWVAVQTYHWRRRLGRRVAVIAVADAGVGFRASLEPTQAQRVGDRWSDAAALEAAIFQGVSRFRDPGRGQGLTGMRRYVGRWDGKLSLRSGTARLSIVPGWDDDVPMADGLPPFPGSQVQLIIPAQQNK
jgi:anti-sigma regulatory factor (Ser/Thr protein kinase)